MTWPAGIHYWLSQNVSWGFRPFIVKEIKLGSIVWKPSTTNCYHFLIHYWARPKQNLCDASATGLQEKITLWRFSNFWNIAVFIRTPSKNRANRLAEKPRIIGLCPLHLVGFFLTNTSPLLLTIWRIGGVFSQSKFRILLTHDTFEDTSYYFVSTWKRRPQLGPSS